MVPDHRQYQFLLAQGHWSWSARGASTNRPHTAEAQKRGKQTAEGYDSFLLPAPILGGGEDE